MIVYIFYGLSICVASVVWTEEEKYLELKYRNTEMVV